MLRRTFAVVSCALFVGLLPGCSTEPGETADVRAVEQGLVTVGVGAGGGSKPPCSEEEIAETGCKGPKDCLYPNPDNCNSFIQCTVNSDGETGTPVVMPCPDDLEWNDIDKLCDWPDAPGTCSGSSN